MNVSIFKLKMVKEDTVKYDARKKFSSPETIFKFLHDELRLHENAEEVFYMISLDTKMQANGIHEISHGSLNASIVSQREVFKRALLNNANSIIVAHNHPSGDPAPSREDVHVTNQLVKAGELLGIQLLDHVVVGDGRYVSLREKGLI